MKIVGVLVVAMILSFLVGFFQTDIENAFGVAETWKEAAIYHCQLNKSCEGVN